jgi:hypothetical protein
MQDQVNAAPAPKRVPWNKGKLTGAKPPLRPKHLVDPDETPDRGPRSRSSHVQSGNR